MHRNAEMSRCDRETCLPSGTKRHWLATMAVAIGVGCVLALGEQQVPPAKGFSLTLLTAAILGLWSGRRRTSSAFWYGAAVTFIAILTSGLISVVVVYRSAPYDQPWVLPPAYVLGAVMFATAMVWGAAGGAFTYTASKILKKMAHRIVVIVLMCGVGLIQSST